MMKRPRPNVILFVVLIVMALIGLLFLGLILLSRGSGGPLTPAWGQRGWFPF